MIPVAPRSEPKNFDTSVRQPGLAWLTKNGIPLAQPAPPKTRLHPYWRNCIPELRRRYKHVCAYAAIRIEEVTGNATVEHFAAKSTARADLAYEWSNYRLVCGLMNSRKRDFDDVLDPFLLAPDTFVLNFATASLGPASSLSAPALRDAKRTIRRLGLNAPELKRTRMRYWQAYVRNGDAIFLKEQAPFVWYEARRQGLL